MKYNLKVTNNQLGQIQIDIFDLCNREFKKSITDYTELQFKSWDEYDVFRIKIYFKVSKLNKSYYILKDLTPQELEFIRHEIEYFSDSSFKEPSEVRISRNLIRSINKLKDVSYQRDLKLSEILR